MIGCTVMNTDTRQPVLILRDAGVCLGGHWAFRHVSLTVGRGEVLSVVGPNGAGKTTLLRAILGLVRLTEGQCGLGTQGGVEAVGYVPQRLEMDRTVPVTVMELLSLNMPEGGGGWWRMGREVMERGREVLAWVEAAGLEGRAVGALSGGELQRVMMACALLRKPELLLLDEPLNAVDPAGAELLERLILRLRGEVGVAVVMVSHDLHMVSAVSDRVLCLNQTMCGLGTPHEVLHEHLLDEVFGRVGNNSNPRGRARAA